MSAVRSCHRPPIQSLVIRRQFAGVIFLKLTDVTDGCSLTTDDRENTARWCSG
ncbi:hypothetical protein [Methylomusa anaerophila]|uniref:hypothetical protein n=1 Tax=Methylomusa anaerophila TaxID=1930071 RepID=UPI0013150BBC|nr:hypothetical protein [Methylomusa anaerophila]